MARFNGLKSEDFWFKAKLFIAKAMDETRDSEERALWASAGLEMLACFCLAAENPTLIANTGSRDGKRHSVFIASGLIDYSEKFQTLNARDLYATCSIAFSKFHTDSALKIASFRNNYLHSPGAGFESSEQEWWQLFWSLVFILIIHSKHELIDLVGSTYNESKVQAILESQAKHLSERYESLKEKSQNFIAQRENQKLTPKELEDHRRIRPINYKYSISEKCPVCSHDGLLHGDEVVDSRIEQSTSGLESWPDVILDIATEEFHCNNCGLRLGTYQLVEIAGLPQTFKAFGDAGEYYEPEYMDE